MSNCRAEDDALDATDRYGHRASFVGPRYVPDAASYRSFADLAAAQKHQEDYRIVVRRVQDSRIAVIAPHGGEIEDGTSGIATEIAGDTHNLYLFEGTRSSHNYRALHLTSHRFDEPNCLSLLSDCDYVIAVHGCRGATDKVFLGGLDTALKDLIHGEMRAAGFPVLADGHPYPALHELNICNRGARRRGVQIEITQSLRHPPAALAVAATIRRVLDSICR